MRWITFLILLFLMSALQGSHLGAFGHGGNDHWPAIEYLPLLAVFYALFGAETAGPMAAIMCGMMYDIVNDEFLGTNMIPLALVAYLLVRVRLSIFREHALSQAILTLLAILAYGLAAVVFRRLIGAPLHGDAMLPHLGQLAGNGLYTAVVAPVVFWFLFRFKHLLGFTPHGPRTRGHG